jgi:hypothetical protein
VVRSATNTATSYARVSSTFDSSTNPT